MQDLCFQFGDNDFANFLLSFLYIKKPTTYKHKLNNNHVCSAAAMLLVAILINSFLHRVIVDLSSI